MSGFSGFPQATFQFIEGIAAHNEKAWFDANRALYDAGYVEPAKAFEALAHVGFPLGDRVAQTRHRTHAASSRLSGHGAWGRNRGTAKNTGRCGCRWCRGGCGSIGGLGLLCLEPGDGLLGEGSAIADHAWLPARVRLCHAIKDLLHLLVEGNRAS